MRAVLLIYPGKFFLVRWPFLLAAGLVAWGLVGASLGLAGLPPAKGPGYEGDIRMYQAVTNRVATGQNYYEAVGTELPARGYAVRPVFNWRLPTLTWLNALTPSPTWGHVVLWALGLAVIVLWTAVVGINIPRVTVAYAVVFALATVAILQAQHAVFLHEVWAGLLIAASLGSWALRRFALSIAFALLAMLVRELAAPYVAIMALMAFRESNRREAIGWLAAMAVFAVLWTVHIFQAFAHMPADGLRNAWLVAGGWPFVLTAARCSVFLMFMPAWIMAILVPLLWAGLWQWTNDTGRRAAWIVSAYFLMFTLAGRPDNWYWGFVVAPLIPLGLFAYFFDPARARA